LSPHDEYIPYLFVDCRIPSTAFWICYEPREKVYAIERLGVHGAAVISVADIGTRLYKQDPVEVTPERLMVEYTLGTAQPLREYHGDRFLGALRMLEQKLYICPHRRLFTDVENKFGFGKHLLVLVSVR
jgi:hypothetical protein